MTTMTGATSIYTLLVKYVRYRLYSSQNKCTFHILFIHVLFSKYTFIDNPFQDISYRDKHRACTNEPNSKGVLNESRCTI